MNALAVERATIAAWPAGITEQHRGWFLLASSGVTGRVNAVWPLEFDGGDLDAAIAHAENWFAARAMPCRFKIADGACAPANLPEELAARGYTATTETAIMTKPLAPHAHADGAVFLHPTLPPLFDDVIAATSASDAEADERRAIARRAPAPAAFALFPGAGGADAIGMSALADGLAGIFLMRTKPEARRQGAARRILRRLLAWAANEGATSAFLQVEADNAPAIALYAAEGFETISRYRFWRRDPQQAD